MFKKNLKYVKKTPVTGYRLKKKGIILVRNTIYSECENCEKFYLGIISQIIISKINTRRN